MRVERGGKRARMEKEIFCDAHGSDIAGWLNETAREKLTSKRCESTSLAEPRCPDAYTRSIVSLSLFFISRSLSILHCTLLNDVFHLISKNATGANAGKVISGCITFRFVLVDNVRKSTSSAILRI